MGRPLVPGLRRRPFVSSGWSELFAGAVRPLSRRRGPRRDGAGSRGPPASAGGNRSPDRRCAVRLLRWPSQRRARHPLAPAEVGGLSPRELIWIWRLLVGCFRVRWVTNSRWAICRVVIPAVRHLLARSFAGGERVPARAAATRGVACPGEASRGGPGHEWATAHGRRRIRPSRSNARAWVRANPPGAVAAPVGRSARRASSSGGPGAVPQHRSPPRGSSAPSGSAAPQARPAAARCPARRPCGPHHGERLSPQRTAGPVLPVPSPPA